MQIYVCVKHVPDSAARITIKDDNRIDESVTFLLNPYDENAIEEAVRLKERGKNSEVIAVTLGTQSALNTLRSALAMGADRAILIKTDDRPDSVVTSRALQQAIEQDGKADIIFAGKESIDSEGMQTMFRLAAALDMPVANNVSVFSMQQQTVTVEYETEAGTTAVIVMDLPCVVGVGKGLNKPRYPTLPNIIKAKKKVIKQVDLNDLKIKASTAKMEILALRPAVEERRAKKITGTPEEIVKQLVQVLREEAKVV
ncbi:MAG: electron transfer flavoprotein subunit beta/FixA family protein [Deltaproteobacteria bacterium]|nr:electron transfer flavoprotein subunit beta/FixA family protein [Deltaproteobacteria bacterium]